jgi:hypothetical protein
VEPGDQPVALRGGGMNLQLLRLVAAMKKAGAVSESPLLAEARILVDWSDAANHGGAYAENQNSPGRTANMFSLVSGLMSNETGATTPTRVQRVTGPGGAATAMRLTATANNQVNAFFRPVAGLAVPPGTYTLRFRCRAVAGTGPHAFAYGQINTPATGSAVDLDWTNPANDAATTFTTTFVYSAGDIAIRLNTTGQSVEIDRLQCYAGDATALPAWGDEVFTGGAPGCSYAGALPLDGDDLVEITARPSGMLLIDPDFPLTHAYSEYTIISASSVDASQTTAGHVMNIHPAHGGTTTGDILFIEGASPYVGEFNTFPSVTRSQMAVQLTGKGVTFMGQRRSATTRTVFFDTIPAFKSTTAFTTKNASVWTVGSFTNTQVASLQGSVAKGKYAFSAVWDRALTDSEYAEAVDAMRTIMAGRSVPMMAFNDWHVISGDSNSTRSDGDWTQRVTAAGFHSPGSDMYAMITSVGGQGIDNIDGTGNRFDLMDAPGLLRGTDNGRIAFYHLCIGTNDWDILDAYTGTNAERAAQYVVRVQALIQQALDLNPRVNVIWYSLLPQTTTSRPNWEAQRLEVNSLMRTWIGVTNRVHICDVGGSATIGSRSLQAGGGGTYYLSDEIHLNPAGDVEFASIVLTSLATARTAAGL